MYIPKAGRLAATLLIGLAFSGANSLVAQESTDANEEVFELSPFAVSGEENVGYRATSSLAGTRFRTELSDIGSSISVLTEEFLTDLGATDNETVLAYAVNTEVGGPRGNFSGGVSQGTVARESSLFANPNGNTRVRGLNSADNTRNYFTTDIPWDGYTVNRVDLLRGPNSILFGLGSPSGVVNATVTGANTTEDGGEFEAVVDQFGTLRASFDYNKVLIEDELGIFVAGLRDDQKFRQEPAYELDERYFVAVNYRPKFLNSDTSMFEFTASFEEGKIQSNRPRIMTPGDNLTSFWNPIAPREEGGDRNFIPYTAATYPGSPGGVGRMTFNQFYDPTGLLDINEGTNFTGGTTGIFLGGFTALSNSNTGYEMFASGLDTYGATRRDGAIADDSEERIGHIYGDNFGASALASATQWASNTGQYGAGGGFWENQTISDPTIFDFYNNLMDGPNKREWTDWVTYEASIAHTFLNGKIGYNLAFFDQKLNRGQYGLFGWEYRVNMDIMDYRGDSTPDAPPPDTGVPNPDVGRAYVHEVLHNTGTGDNASDRTAYRAQLFAEHDFTDNADNLFTRILGTHRFTGLRSQETNYRDNRSINMALVAPEVYERFGGGSDIGLRHYVSGDLRGMNSPRGANLHRIYEPILPNSGTVSARVFDTTWNAPDVDPSDPWPDPDDLRSDTFDTQAENPANYVGWTETGVRVISFLDEGTVNGMSHRDYLTERATLSDAEIDSNVLVWQGHFFNDAIVGLYGYREDSSETFRIEAQERAWSGVPNMFIDYPDLADVRPSAYNLVNPANPEDLQNFDLETETTNWSVAVHLNKLMGDRDFLPINVSLYYNEGENAQPAAGRLDAYGQPLPPPQGTTEEYSVLLATKDGKFSLRATEYETNVTNQNTTGSIGNMWALEQTVFAPAISYANFQNGTWNTADHPDPEYLENVILPAWRQFEADLEEQFPGYVNAWVNGEWNPSNSQTGAQNPVGHTFTEDAISKGREFEFMANPTDNWRIAINAAQVEAIRDNVPGQAFLEVSAFVDDQIMNTPVGQIPVWWSASPGVRENIYPTYRGDYLKLLALNGQVQPEVREWRTTVITNYSFTNGKFAGLGVGGAYRWEDSAALDYLPSEENDTLPDIENPVMDDGYDSLDLWLSYGRPITDNVNWRIQLNLYNAFADNELVTLSTDPFGNPNRFRIREGQSWRLSNTFEF